MHLDNVIITKLECHQVLEKTKRIACLWEPRFDLLLPLVIFDSHLQNQKIMNVTGVLQVFEAHELTFMETYVVTLNNHRTTLTLSGKFDRVQTCKVRNPDANVRYFREQ